MDDLRHQQGEVVELLEDKGEDAFVPAVAAPIDMPPPEEAYVDPLLDRRDMAFSPPASRVQHDLPDWHPTEPLPPYDSGDDVQPGDLMERVDANEIGVTRDVLERARVLTNFCLMAYPGGKDLAKFGDHLQNRNMYAQSTRESYEMDSKRLQERLDAMNTNPDGTPKPEGEQYKASIFRASAQQAVVYHNDHEIILAFEGSDGFEVKHWFRNLLKSVNLYQKNVFFREELMDGDPEYEHKVEALAERMLKPDDFPFEKEEMIKAIKGARVHGGWWDTLHLKLQHGPNKQDGDTLWSAIERHIETVEADLKAKGHTPKITFSGHSSGGSLSMIAAAQWMQDHEPIKEIYTFGQPRVGNIPFRESLYKLMGNGITPIYRFEMIGDPIPSLPPLWSFMKDHLVHCGNWICMAPNGNLVALRHNGHLITPQEAAQSTKKAMTSISYFKKRPREKDDEVDPQALSMLEGVHFPEDATKENMDELIEYTDHFFDERARSNNGFVFTSRAQREEAWDKAGGKHILLDNVFAGFFKTLLNFASHLSGRSAYRHILPTMREALNRQIRMEDLREAQGSPMKIGALVEALQSMQTALVDAKERGMLPNIQSALLDKLGDDIENFAELHTNIVPGYKQAILDAGADLAVIRGKHFSWADLKTVCEPSSMQQTLTALKQSEKALAGDPERAAEHEQVTGLITQLRSVLHQMEYFMASNAPISLDKSTARLLGLDSEPIGHQPAALGR